MIESSHLQMTESQTRKKTFLKIIELMQGKTDKVKHCLEKL